MARSKSDGKVTQKQMVRDALGEKGWAVSPTELQAYIRDKYDVELPNNVISNYKSNIKKEDGAGGASVTPPPVHRSTGGLDMTDVEAVKGLVTRLGAAQVKKLAEMFE
ncbi:hypothetical protein GobsT_31690 [Gemmata obscuriglobus]|uniref:Uncharacterized protein n=1 Tax=Gemmata obscuriglobus TaxID=114 RepID=A0A2Z3HBR0_9BACT|nr:hypothetical protein [Gemmata obscuriglobus]AWM38650.1 hypothetical protein C1280_17760 [Gemmata obscuriglobus]QEG28391.1 hypothetical protein GobsT_31690 [Gemmata obscuriglobus]VTS06319.1 unnamed protein product [Gemmata obscuriglobus UQM 2246]